jgi:ribonuclease III
VNSRGGDTEQFAAVERQLGYRFVDRDLLQRALTHRSHGERHNERLEFLGDAVLGLIIADWLYRAFPAAREHDLTLMRANLVKRPALARVARELDLGEHLRLGIGERKSGGHRRDSILADALEAVLGAILCDGGFETVRGVIERLFADHVEAVDAAARDSKTVLQERLQARRLSLPRYTVTAQRGEAHAPRFTVACRIDDLGITTEGVAGSRREAEQRAAAAALTALDHSDD